MAYEGKWNKWAQVILPLPAQKKEHVSKQLTQTEEVKYLGIYLDRKLTWSKHISGKTKQLDLKPRKLHWIIGRKTQLSLENKLLVYKATPKICGHIV